MRFNSAFKGLKPKHFEISSARLLSHYCVSLGTAFPKIWMTVFGVECIPKRNNLEIFHSKKVTSFIMKTADLCGNGDITSNSVRNVK